MVLERTRVVRPPRQSLDTFGVTKIRYHLVTEPAFQEVNPAQTVETVVRGGVVKAERPQVVTPYYLLNTESFSAGAREFLEHLSRSQGPDFAGPTLFVQERAGRDGHSVGGRRRGGGTDCPPTWTPANRGSKR